MAGQIGTGVMSRTKLRLQRESELASKNGALNRRERDNVT